MSWLSRVVNVFRASKVNGDIDEELRFHLEARVEDLVQQGMTRDAAEVQAARQLGNRLRIREGSRDVKLLPWLESILKDVRFGLRMLRKDAGVSAAAVTSLALAIGACGAAFSLVDALILRPLPVREPGRLIYLTYPTYSAEDPESSTFSYPMFEHLRKGADRQVDLFGVSVLNRRRVVFPDGAREEEPVRMAYVSGTAFETLGVAPAIGRLLMKSDDVSPGAHPVAVLSYAFWTRRFGRDPSVIGRRFTMSKQQFEIVGVARRGFAGVEPGLLADFWVPTMMYDAKAFGSLYWNWFRILGRLRSGVTAEQARSALQTVFTNVRREHAKQAPPHVPRDVVKRYVDTPIEARSAATGPSALRRRFERPLWILAAVVGLVLLIAGSNVANLLLARAAAREREMSLRLSIGAGRGRLVQQVLIETGLLAAAACVLGLLVAVMAAPGVVVMLAPADNPAYLDVRIDWRLLAFLGGVGAITTLLFGLAPALRASGAAPIGALKAGGGRLGSRAGFLPSLITVQAAFSVAVLFVAGLLLLSFVRLSNTDPGFATSGLLVLSLTPQEPLKPEVSRVTGLQLIDRVRSMPGVADASLSAWALFGGAEWTAGVRMPGGAREEFEPYHLQVSPRFFSTMRMPILDGREFVPGDTERETPSAVVVNQAFAKRYFADARAVGRAYERFTAQGPVRQEIVGVVADAKYNDLRQPTPATVYVPYRDLGTLQVRTTGDPLALLPTLRREVRAVHPSLRVSDVRLQSTLVGNTLLRERLLALLSGFFAVVGLLLAAVGLYGVLNYSIVRRTREIGICLALGAPPQTVVRSVVARAGLMTALGMIGGLVGGLFLARFIRTLLYEVEPLDLWSLVLPIACLSAAGLLAAVPPARKATRVDPVVALRVE